MWRDRNLDMQRRILLVSRQPEMMDKVTSILESDGYIVSGTSNDDIAVDLAASSEFDALLVGGGVSEKERAALTAEIRRYRPSIAVVRSNAPESVLTLLNQEFRVR